VRTTTERETTPLGILGGTFDPIHNGHLAIAALAIDCFKLSGVLFIPSGRPPHKSLPGASVLHRVTMLRLATASEPSFEVRKEEVRQTGFSYTFDTLKKLQRVFPRRPFYFIIGSDNLCEIETWHRYKELLRMVTFCVAHRPGFSLSPPPSLAGGDFFPFPAPEWGISATLLRTYLAKGYRCRYLVPEAVREYIAKNRLYTLQNAERVSQRHDRLGPE
jgi:nicotinate-nucleotide adenylyltransferase